MSSGHLLLVVAFVLGSIPPGLLIVQHVHGRDVREYGSGNIGASNVAYTAGWQAGFAVALLDIAKGVAPVLIGRFAGLDARWLAAIAVAAVMGHDFSVFLRFRGGKGIATTFGVFLVLGPAAMIATLITWLLVWRGSGYVAVASLAALAILPAALVSLQAPRDYVLAAVFLFVLGAAKHWENILRLAHGTEEGSRRKHDINRP